MSLGRMQLRVVLYARRSLEKQSIDGQLIELRRWVADNGHVVVGECQDDVTGNPLRRKGDPPGLRQALAYVEKVNGRRRADLLLVFAADRLVRSPLELLNLVARIQAHGAHVKGIDDGHDLDTTTDTGELLTFIRGWFARFERKLIGSRTRAGLEGARARGVKLGRPRTLDAAAIGKVHTLRGKGLGVRAIARELAVAPAIVSRALKELGVPVAETAVRKEPEAPSETKPGARRLGNDRLRDVT